MKNSKMTKKPTATKRTAPKPTHRSKKMKMRMRIWRLEGLPAHARWNINTHPEDDENICKRYAAGFAIAPLVNGKVDARNIDLWRTSERITKWLESLKRTMAAVSTSDLKEADSEQIRMAAIALMSMDSEMRKLIATSCRAMMLEHDALNALVEANNNVNKGK